jgi:hypothetical protein
MKTRFKRITNSITITILYINLTLQLSLYKYYVCVPIERLKNKSSTKLNKYNEVL